MIKIAAIIGGVLLLAGVALAGTVTSLGTSNTPTLSGSLPAASTTARQDDRGRENEVRGRANEAGEDLRGPCDEAEHANDPRCVGVAGAGTTTVTTRDDDRRGHDDRGGQHRRGHGGDDDRGDDHGGNSGRGGGGESGHGGHGGDD